MSPKEDAPDSGLWKDSVDVAFVRSLAKTFGRVYPAFDPAGFVNSVVADRLDKRELKDRLTMIARQLRDFLPREYAKAVKIIMKVAPELRGFGNWALTSYVEQFGLDDPNDSIRALKELTKYGSSEFAVRPFIVRYPKLMLATLTEWAHDSNEDVRRLAAEGSRPRGVWTIHVDNFKRDPRPVLKILELLKADESLYVRKAVANNLNDISKDHPDIAIATALKWKKKGNSHTDWIIKHACRSLIKQGHPEAFEVFGYTSNPKLDVTNIKSTKKQARIGEDIRLSFDIVSRGSKKQKLVIDYRVHYVKKNGKTSPKVFKLTEKTIAPKETISISTGHSFKDRSTRKHQPGPHRFELLINGTTQGECVVNLRR
jgi:3-methyladenine DNA glycosylase AlkC